MGFFDYFRSAVGGGRVLLLFNTLGKEVQMFSLPPNVKRVRMYNCGPTVYGVQHIGNLSMFVFTDVLRRTLEYNGFDVKQIINITDVGHLTSDADDGEDKMSKGLREARMALTLENMAKLAQKYTDIFLADLGALNIDTTRIEFPRASSYIAAQVAMIQSLQEKGYAYKTNDGVYFDTTKFVRYGELGGIDLAGLKEGARVAVAPGKRHPTDFALWKLDSNLGWNSPWGQGFPGWHIECSAMIRALLGQQIDIHTGGIEHIPVHHNNEIAQSECATGKRPLSRFWLHREHIQMDGGKIAKSKGNVVYLSQVVKRRFHPLALRYLFLGAHYRTSTNFSWEALVAAQTALAKLVSTRLSLGTAVGSPSSVWQAEFARHINNDINTPGALATMWDMLRDRDLTPAQQLATLLDFDRVLGLGLAEPSETLRTLGRAELVSDAIPEDVRELLVKRNVARQEKNWGLADSLRDEIGKLGYQIDDTGTESRVSLIPPQQN